MDQIPKAIRAADKSVKALIEGRLSLDNLDEVVDTLGESTLMALHVVLPNTVQSCATSMTVMSLSFLVESFSASPLELSASRKLTCKSSSHSVCFLVLVLIIAKLYV